MNRAFKEYAFIAHVKIKRISGNEKEDSVLTKYNTKWDKLRRVEVEILELFKGEKDIVIAESGVGTSCAMGIQENEEWVLFGNYLQDKKYVLVSYCNVWIKLTNALGEWYWMHDAGTEAMRELRKLASIPEKVIKDGKQISFYRNGNTLAEEYYKNGLLDGYRKVYYSNGILMKEGLFANGKPSGSQKEYTSNGQLISETVYLDNNTTYSARWYDTSFVVRKFYTLFSESKSEEENIPPPVIQKEMESWYDTASENFQSIKYARTGEKMSENYVMNNGKSRLICEYYSNGIIKLEAHYFNNTDFAIEKTWDDKGNLLNERRWLKGKIIFNGK